MPALWAVAVPLKTNEPRTINAAARRAVSRIGRAFKRPGLVLVIFSIGLLIFCLLFL
jgi:hypothetical protein